MPSALEHHTWGEQNERFSVELMSSQPTLWQPWAITALFYAAVHEVQSLLVEHGAQPRSHDDRRRELLNRWPNLAVLYDSVYNRSKDARYNCVIHQQPQLALAQMALNMVRAEVANSRPPGSSI